MTIPIVAQKNAVHSVIALLRQRSKPLPKEADLLIPRLEAALVSLTNQEWCVERKDLILKARELEKLEAGNADAS